MSLLPNRARQNTFARQKESLTRDLYIIRGFFIRTRELPLRSTQH
jgi:hypothetical protein